MTGIGPIPGWPGPALLVPVHVEVLILTTESYNGDWWWGAPGYNGFWAFQPPTPSPLGFIAPTIPGFPSQFTGAMVYWSLPDGLTHGIEAEPGVIQYPPVPNRWIVTRKSVSSDDPTQWSYTSAIVASDYATTQAGTNGSQFLNPAGTIAGRNTGLVLGNSWPLSEWPGEESVSPFNLVPPLTAVGAGDPTFAAFVPNVVNVFAYPDSLADLAAGFVSYSVLGYYSDPRLDPLFGATADRPAGWYTFEQWRELMDQLRWSVGNDADLFVAQAASELWAEAHGIELDPNDLHQFLPARTICHGQTFAVQWPGADAPAPSGAPPVNPGDPNYIQPQVAVGNSAVDALAAMLANDSTSLNAPAIDILEAFQYGCLSEVENQGPLDAQLQHGWFNSAGGQTVWQVVAAGRKGTNPAPPLSPERAALLMELNVAQSALDTCTAQTGSLQAELFSLWWKNGYLPQDLSIPFGQKGQYQGLINAAIPAAETSIDQQLAAWAVLRRRRDAAFVALQRSLNGLQLQAGAATPFLAPNEPVVMISGVQRSFLHGEDGVLFCRFTGQTIASLTVPAGTVVDAAVFGLPRFTVGPPELNDLAVEAAFLDVTNGPLIAYSLNPSNPWSQLAAIEREQTLIWNPALHPPLDLQTIAELSGLNTMFGLGALPSKTGVQLWSPPWSPLYLQWNVSFTPAGDPSSALQPWTLPSAASDDDDGALVALDELTFAYGGGTAPSGGPQLVGMSLLTPQATAVLAARIEQFIDEEGSSPNEQMDVAALQDALSFVRNADLLSQSLTGFNQALLQRATDYFRIPDDGSLDPWLFPANGPHFHPLSMPDPDATDAQFNPIRAGFMQVQALWIVDAFGQVFDVMQAMLSTPANFNALTGPDLTPLVAGTPTVLQLKPRIVQFSRFVLTFLSAVNDLDAVGVAPGANPICGWLIPNHLDRSLLVYSASGDFLGELFVGADGATWELPPDAVPADRSGSARMTGHNAHLRDLVNGILASSDSGGALEALLDIMQQSLWTLDPNGGWSDQELPALIGKPLAVVRASGAMQLLAEPSWSQTWANTGAYDTAGFDDVLFPVRLGSTELTDDGVVGTFINDDYGQIQSAHSPAPASAYVGQQPLQLAFHPASSALLTLIVDPTASIHAITGIYPPLAFALPAPFTTPALAKMEMVFRTGPVVGQSAPVGMPLPSLREGAWSWLQYPSTTSVAAQSAVLDVDATAAVPREPSCVREGWLKLLLGGSPTKLTYAVSPGTVPCSSAVTVTVTAYNATGVDVLCSEIAFAIAVGSKSGDLTASPAAIVPTTAPESLWRIRSAGDGQLVATPDPPLSVVRPGATLTFLLNAVRINGAGGTTSIAVAELSDTTRKQSLSLTKVKRS